MKTDPQVSTSTSSRLRQEDFGPTLVGQVIAGLGASLALLGPFSEAVAGVGVFVLIAGVVLSAPAGGYPGPVMNDWWSVLALAALATLIGFGLSFWLTAPGGVILSAGAVVSLVAVFFGTPVRRS